MQGMNYLQKLKHGSAIVFKNILKHARLNNDGVLQIIPFIFNKCGTSKLAKNI